MQAEHEKLVRPLFEERQEPTTNSEAEANLLSSMFLLFIQKTLNKAVELDENMEVEHLEPMIRNDRATRCFKRFRTLWEAEMASNPSSPNLLKVLFLMNRYFILVNIFWVTLECAAPFTSVVLMRYVNEFVADTEQPMWKGGVLAVSFFVSSILTTVGTAQGFRILARQMVRMTACLQMEVLRKTIQLSTVGMKKCGQGNLFQVFNGDTARLSQMLASIFRCYDCLFQTIGVFVYLGVLAGWPACGAVFVFLIALPINHRISDGFFTLFFKKMIAGDKRTKKVIEMVNSVRVIKFFGWERPFLELVQKLRAPELKMVSALMKQLALLMSSFGLATPIMQLVLFILITVKEGSFGVLTFFQALALTNILSITIIQLPTIYSQLLQVRVSLYRINEVLSADERPEGDHVLPLAENVGDVIIKNATFLYEPEQTEPIDGAGGGETRKTQMALQNVNFRVSKGELVMVVGKVGSGKSSLISAILGDMILKPTTSSDSPTVVKRKGSVAYVPQSAWILNATVRNNIILNLPFDPVWYERVIEAVDLRVDFSVLPNGDLTEVGEKGINLSGGQRQRVSLARAVYSNADIYVFDDPLSALDAQVGRHVFSDAIAGLLADKARILVTHQMAYLAQATRIYVADNMRIVEETLPSNVSDVAQDGESTLATMLRAWQQTSQSATAPTENSASVPKEVSAPVETAVEQKTKKSSGKLTIREERLSGRVNNSTLFLYLKSFGGLRFWVPMLLGHIVAVCCNIFAQLWMAFWTGFRYPDFIMQHDEKFFLGIYAAAIGSASLVVLIRELWWRVGSVNAPRRIYHQMCSAVLHAPMSFFDVTPAGRIINRFTKDSEQLDFMLPLAANQTITLFFMQFGSLVAMSVIMPYFAPVAAVVMIGLFFAQPNVATVVLRRLSSSTAGPVAALYSEAVAGATTIRTLCLTEYFEKRFSQYLDDANAAQYSDHLLFEAVRVRVNIFSAFLQAAMMLIIMAMRNSLKPYEAAFIVSNGSQVMLYMVYMMIQRGNLVLSLNSIERMNEYCKLEGEPNGPTSPPADWPQTGAVELSNVTAQYRHGLPNVLNNVSFSIQSGEKIGVCGRTGSGKSSLLLTLFRLVPILGESKLTISGVDTASMPLECLRSKLSAIPQEPVLFSGTVAENLDPFNTVPRERLREALDRCHLRDPLEKLLKSKDEKEAPESGDILDIIVGDGDLSVGQKQLLCLARAVSRNMKVLVLDEATSSVDVHTDQMIQQTIRQVFEHSTVITVAHRLNTIMDSDRVLVLDCGRVVEFDAPATLLRSPESAFAKLVQEAALHDEELNAPSPQ